MTKRMSKEVFMQHLGQTMVSASFTNILGVRFELYTQGNNVLITGDELEWEMMELFNLSFNTWSIDEINSLGIALQLLAKRYHSMVT